MRVSICQKLRRELIEKKFSEDQNKAVNAFFKYPDNVLDKLLMLLIENEMENQNKMVSKDTDKRIFAARQQNRLCELRCLYDLCLGRESSPKLQTVFSRMRLRRKSKRIKAFKLLKSKLIARHKWKRKLDQYKKITKPFRKAGYLTGQTLSLDWTFDKLKNTGHYFTPLEKIWIRFYFSFPSSRKGIFLDETLSTQISDMINDARMAGFSYPITEVMGEDAPELVAPLFLDLQAMSKTIREKTNKPISADDIVTLLFSWGLAECKRQYYSGSVLEMANIANQTVDFNKVDDVERLAKIASKNHAVACMYLIRPEPKNMFKDDFDRIKMTWDKQDAETEARLKEQETRLRYLEEHNKKLRDAIKRDLENWTETEKELQKQGKSKKEIVELKRKMIDVLDSPFLKQAEKA